MTNDTVQDERKAAGLAEAFGKLQSRIGSLLHIESKVRRWGLESKEPRTLYREAGRTNFSILLSEFADTKASMAEVETALISEMLAGMPDCVASSLARQLAEQKGVQALREVLGADRMADLPVSKWPEVEQACRAALWGPLTFVVDTGKLYVAPHEPLGEAFKPEPEPTESELSDLRIEAGRAVGSATAAKVLYALAGPGGPMNIARYCRAGYDRRRLAAEFRKLIDSDVAKQLRALKEERAAAEDEDPLA